MESDNLGKRLIRSLIHIGEFNLAKYGIDIHDLSFDAHAAALFISKFQQEYDKLPSEDQITENVSIEFTKEPEEPRYVADLIIKRNAEFELENDLKKAARILRDDGPKEADTFLKAISSKTYFKDNDKDKLEYFVAGALERYQRYLDKKSQPVKGVPFPWETLNKACMGLLPGEMSVFIAQSNTGKCLEENTLVTSSCGLRKTIKEIVEQRLSIYSIDPDTKEFSKKTPVDWFYSGEKECFKVTFKTGDSITCSKDHPILTDRGWVKVEDLSVGKTIARAGFIPEPDVTSEWNKEELILVSALIADGCLTRTDEITYTKSDSKLIDLMQKSCNALNLNFYKRPSQEGTYTWTIGKACDVWEILQKYGVSPGKSCQKMLSDVIYRLPNEAVSLFLGVFMSHDGDIYTNRNGVTTVSVSLSSKALTEGIRHLLLRLGIFSTYSEKITNFNTKAYRLYLRSSERRKFFDRVPIFKTFDMSVKFRDFKSKGTETPSIFWDEVSNIESVGFKRTYDLSVADTHSFEAGYTHVHNSWGSCIVASNALKLGHRVLLVTMEMSAERIAGRLDCVHYGIPYSDVRQNEIEVFNEMRWRSNLDAPQEGEILILDNENIQYVEDIVAHCATFKPDIVIIDGGYIIKSRVNGNNWEQTSDVIKALQEHCQKTKIPWMVTTQQNPPDKKVMTSQQKAATVRYGKEWWLVSDVMVEMSQTQDQRDFLREVTFNIIKIREADKSDIKTEFKAEWDFDMARFGELPEDFEYELEVDY
jgi:replicative DNA helicase